MIGLRTQNQVMCIEINSANKDFNVFFYNFVPIHAFRMYAHEIKNLK